jgi:hypothetical protein
VEDDVAIDWGATMQGFITQLGLDRLEQDEDGMYTLQLGEGAPLFLMIADETDEVLLFGGVGKLQEESAGAASMALLRANHFWTETGGFTLCLVPDALDVLLVARRRLNESPAEDLADLCRRFATAVTVWRQRLPEIDKVADTVH